MKFVLLGCVAIVATSCAYHGGERQRHELKGPDGRTITCFEPPPEVVQNVSVALDVSASIKDIEGLIKNSVRGDVTPERIRDRLPKDVVVFEHVNFQLCVNYANGIYSSEEYRAFLTAKTLFENERKSPESSFMATERDSFCYLGFLFAVGGEDRPSLVVYHDGKYPLQNIHITMTDVELMNATLPDIPKGREKARPITIDELDKLDKLQAKFYLPALGPPGAIQELRRTWKLPERDQVTYSIQINTQFQTFYQHLKLRKVNGSWSEAYRVIKHAQSKEIVVLREKVPDNFPRGPSGKVNWLYFE